MNEPQFSLAYLTVVNTPPTEMVHMAANAGYDFISLRPIYMGLPGEPNFSLAANPSLLRETKRAMNSRNINLLDIELARIADGIDPIQYEPEMEVAAELGAKHVLSSIWTDNHGEALEKFAKLCDLAAQYNLTVDLEYVPIASVSNLKGVMDVLNTTNRRNAGLMIDIHHFHRAHDSISELAKIPNEWFHFVHLCDASGQIPEDHDEMIRIVREARSYVGEGGIDVAGIVNAIPQVPYSIELPNKEQSDILGYEEFARRCLETSKAYLAKHPRKVESIF